MDVIGVVIVEDEKASITSSKLVWESACLIGEYNASSGNMCSNN